MTTKRRPYKTAHVFHFEDAVASIWKMLNNGDVCQRAGAILLLREITSSLVASGKYEQAARLVRTMRSCDPKTRDENKPMKVW